ncbi:MULTISPECIES: hypothetical protein [unclassified Polaribacter]|uniref:hypothetical protein n=1 Tax=unclassified Polaribacter TaxID=196858 RepID=UPI0011BE8102|nr:MULTISPECIES: hypothetical protein [unclassified Polaribacter]TXD52754.1 hypothetical protein ES043_06885 [Polaribacter sp. IC063]TXD61631.1 hypothetical protein ES044_03845 [Polaribacter sp. IC066]
MVIFSFTTKEKKSVTSNLMLKDMNAIEVLLKQQFECRPSSKFMFYVETNLIKKVRGANNISAKVYFLDKVSGQKKLLAAEIIQVSKFKGAIALQQIKT